jgi:hypothetical protein
MQETIEIGTNLRQVSTKLDDAQKAFDRLREIVVAAEKELEDPGWLGEAKEKCVYIHQAVSLYLDRIEEHLPDIRASVSQLDTNDVNFPTKSDNIAIISVI